MSNPWRCWTVNEPPLPVRIEQLPEVLANQIAAGEVVERPAAVVKELVENSIDAGAVHIRVDVENGGIDLIRVRDDGSGIVRADLPLAVARHATSKLRSFEELQSVATLGFRGEALPSIASVARVRLSSRTRTDEHAYALELAGSAEPGEPVPCAHPPGTTVEVRDLFFNTPARRRFLRTARTEFLHIEATLKRIALAAAEVRIQLHSGARRVFDALGAAALPRRRLQALLGKAFAEDAVIVEDQAAEMMLTGWISAGGRAHDDIQYMSVNGRGVRDPVLRHAIRAGFAEHLLEGRQAGFVLALDMPATSVDVNVHPTKHELRFRETRAVHDFVVSAISSALGEGLGLETDALEEFRVESSPPLPLSATLSEFPMYAPPHPLAGGAARSATQNGVERQVPAPGHWVRQLAPAMVLTSVVDSHYLVDFAVLSAWVVRVALTGSADGLGRRQQPLLLPHVWRPPANIAERLEAEAGALAAVGVEVRRSGGEEWLVVSVPRALQPLPMATLIATFEGWLEGYAPTPLVDALADCASTSASTLNREALETWLTLAGLDDIDIASAWVRLDRVALASLFQR